MGTRDLHTGTLVGHHGQRRTAVGLATVPNLQALMHHAFCVLKQAKDTKKLQKVIHYYFKRQFFLFEIAITKM